MPAACSRRGGRDGPHAGGHRGRPVPSSPRSARRRADGGRDRHAAREPRRSARAAPHAAQARPRSRRLPDARRAPPRARAAAGRRGRALPEPSGAPPTSRTSGASSRASRSWRTRRFRPDDGELLLACRHHARGGAWRSRAWTTRSWGDMVMRASITAERRRRVLADAAAHAPAHRAAPAGGLGLCSWARSSGRSATGTPRQAAEGEPGNTCRGSSARVARPNLKRVIDLTRIASAAQLLANPGFTISDGRPGPATSPPPAI